jgi:hypothetical protein
MINVRKGTAHSLQQSDVVGFTGCNSIVAGMICSLQNDGVIYKGNESNSNYGVIGFAINNATDGDVIESGKIGLYLLDGNSIIETDQVDLATDSASTINTSDYPIGTALFASDACRGKVMKTKIHGEEPDDNVVIGWVVGVRYLQNATPYPSGFTASQDYISGTEQAAINGETVSGNYAQAAYTPSQKTAVYKYQTNVPVLAIKLNSTAGNGVRYEQS